MKPYKVYVDKAEELRVISALMRDENASALLITLASTYEAMAEQSVAMAEDRACLAARCTEISNQGVKLC